MTPDPDKPYQTVESNMVTKATFVCDLRDYGEGPKLVLVLTRGNSRQFDYGTARFLQLVSSYGVKVLVSIAGVEISLEQFEQCGVWGIKKSQTVQSPQGRYNMTTEANRLRGELIGMKQDDPRQSYIVQRINALEAQLNTAQPKNLQGIEATKKSEEDLMRVTELIQRDAFDAFLLVSEEEIAKIDNVDDLSKFSHIAKGTRQWLAVISKWSQARTKFAQQVTTPQGDNNNVNT